MRVEIDDKSGFCFGVVRAIDKAEESLAAGERIYSLGDIVHNGIEVERLEKLGLSTVSHDALPYLKGKKVLIRAHGEPPSTYTLARESGVEIIDATCPVVAKLQELVVEAYRTMKPVGGQVVILGKRGHAEVVGLAGQIPDAIVVEGVEDLDAVDFSRPVFLLSQTTQSLDLFGRVSSVILERAADNGKVTVRDTVCRQVAGREEHLKEFAAKYDVVVFVCGAKSSNGKVLYEACRSINPRCYKIESAGELCREWFEGFDSVGICGATSTPHHAMQQVADKIKNI